MIEMLLNNSKQKEADIRTSYTLGAHSYIAEPVDFDKCLEGIAFREGSMPGPDASAVPGDFVEIAVSDTGIGIKREDLPKLFQVFTQLEPALTKQSQGTGPGIALTKQLVELHGGSIRATSAGQGRGSTFMVRLPLSSQTRPGPEG